MREFLHPNVTVSTAVAQTIMRCEVIPFKLRLSLALPAHGPLFLIQLDQQPLINLIKQGLERP